MSGSGMRLCGLSAARVRPSTDELDGRAGRHLDGVLLLLPVASTGSTSTAGVTR